MAVSVAGEQDPDNLERLEALVLAARGEEAEGKHESK